MVMSINWPEMSIGFVLGVVASAVFWGMQIAIRPRIAVSDSVAMRSSRNPAVPFYEIKVVNKSCRHVVDLILKLQIDEDVRDGRGPRRRRKHIVAVTTRNATLLGPSSGQKDIWAVGPSHYFQTEPDPRVDQLLSGDRRLVATIQATDALSGARVVIRRSYTRSDIKHGRFEPDSGLQVRPIDASSPAELAADSGDDEPEL